MKLTIAEGRSSTNDSQSIHHIYPFNAKLDFVKAGTIRWHSLSERESLAALAPDKLRSDGSITSRRGYANAINSVWKPIANADSKLCDRILHDVTIG